MNLTIGKRIASAIVLLLLLMSIVGVFGYISISRVLTVVDHYQKFNTIRDLMSSIKEKTDSYLLANISGEMDLQEKAAKEVFISLENGMIAVEKMIKQSGKAQEDVIEKLMSVQEMMGQYQPVFNAYMAEEPDKQEIKREINTAYRNTMGMIKKGLWMEEIDIAGKILFAGYKAYINRPSSENWASLQNDLGILSEKIDKWFTLIENVEKLREIAGRFRAEHDVIKTNLDRYREKKAQQEILRAEMDEYTSTLHGICEDIASTSLHNLKKETRRSILLIFAVIVGAFFVGTVYAFISTKKIVAKLNGSIKGINNGAQQVASVSTQVLSASQSLAEGASEQAASLEASSASLEEMSAMIRQNADNANEADSLMVDAKQVVSHANVCMRELTESMEEISNASEETSKIVKSIDEIAFQTNLLALNAAVEAARAGEAGTGFAVVADEVRNLAMRAADAAKNTAGLIEGTVKKVNEGAGLVKKTNDNFNQVSESSRKVAALVSEIAAASNEQAQGIDQVNSAVVDMDKVTQQNAANAEESASASEEMNTQAENMKAVVKDLIVLVGGTVIGKKNVPSH